MHINKILNGKLLLSHVLYNCTTFTILKDMFVLEEKVLSLLFWFVLQKNVRLDASCYYGNCPTHMSRKENAVFSVMKAFNHV